MRLADRIRAFFWSDSPPWKMGLSAAIGAFVAATPTVGLQTVLVIVAVSIVRGNRGVALLASAVANPWTIPFIYFADFKAGALVTGESTWAGLPERITLGGLGGAFAQMLLGSLLVGGAFASVAGFATAALCKLRRSRVGADGCRYEAAR